MKYLFGIAIILGFIIKPLGRLLQEVWCAYEWIVINPDKL